MQLPKLPTFTKFTKQQYITAGIAALAVVIVLGIFISQRGNGAEHIAVERRDVVEEVAVTGRVEAGTVADLGFEVSGRVAGIYADEGDVVPQGTALVSLDLGTLLAQLSSAQADVVIKEADVANAQTNLDDVTAQQDTLVESAYRTLLSDDLEAVSTSDTITITPPVISGRYTGPEGQYRIRIRPRENSEDYELLVFGIERDGPRKINELGTTQLGTYGLFVSFPETITSYEETLWTIDVPNTAGDSYTTNVNAYEKALRDREVALEAAQADVIAQQSGISIAEAQLMRARAEVARIQAEIANRRIVAPFDGIVAQMDVDPGEIVAANTAVVSLISNNGFGIEIDLPEIDSVRVHTGDKARVTLDAFGEGTVFDAVVTSINRTETDVDGVPVYEARLSFTEDDDRIRSGMTADVTIVTEERPNVLALPARAISFRDDGTTYAHVLEGGTVRDVDVATGVRGSDSYYEILAGLSEGDTVVVPN